MIAATPAELRGLPVTLSVPEAGRMIGLGREAAYRAAKDGQLPGALQIGKRWRVVTSRLIEFLGVSPPDNGEGRPDDQPGDPPTEQSADHRRDQRRGEGSLRAIVPGEVGDARDYRDR